jgi:hypothetical protein
LYTQYEEGWLILENLLVRLGTPYHKLMYNFSKKKSM